MCFFSSCGIEIWQKIEDHICCWQRVGSFQGRLAIAWEWDSNFWEWLRHLTECVDIMNFLAIWVSQEAWERTNKGCTFLQEGRWSAMMEYSSSLFVGLKACDGKAHLSMHNTTFALLAPRKDSEKSSEERSQKMEFFSCHRCCARMTILLSWKSTCGSSIQLSRSWGWPLSWPIIQVAGCSKVRKGKIIQMIVDAFFVVWPGWNWNPKIDTFCCFCNLYRSSKSQRPQNRSADTTCSTWWLQGFTHTITSQGLKHV